MEANYSSKTKYRREKEKKPNPYSSLKQFLPHAPQLLSQLDFKVTKDS